MSIWSRIERGLSELADLLPDEFRTQLIAAQKLLATGEVDQAQALIETLLKSRPDHPGALALLGAVQLERRDPEAARASFERALAIDPASAESLLGRGEAQLALGDIDAAIDSFRRATDVAGGDRGILALAYRGLGVSQQRRGDIDKAIRELRKAVAEAPRDGLALAALGDALLADPDRSSQEARRHLEKAAGLADPPALAFVGLGRIALAEGDAAGAATHFSRALEIARDNGGTHLAALAGLGDAALLAGDRAQARSHLEHALLIDPRRAVLHARLGDAAVDPVTALESYRRAIDLGADAGVVRRALDTALLVGDIAAAIDLANRMLAVDPREPRALVARGLSLIAGRQWAEARATLTEALAARDDAEAHIALARLALAEDASAAAGRGAAADALSALRIEPENPRALALLAQARERELAEPPGEEPAGSVEGMYSLAVGLHRLALARSELSGMAADIARAVSDLDEPLLVTVMGEFSSGKSSFVNAFIGAEVAPTGITPTTATINVVKHGRERGGRIVYRDGTVESLLWKDVFPTLHEVGPERARKISTVEILLPLDILERVCIVDTPGLNSILPEHEEVARSFIARADAVIWVFTAGQAGKASERAALERIRGEGKRILGVLNKIDQLSAQQVAEVVAHVEAELGPLIEIVVPLSARRAIAHAPSGSGDSSGDGNWAALAAALEERFFARARELKLAAAERRLGNLIAAARDQASARVGRTAAAAAAFTAAAERAAADRDRFIDQVVTHERRQLTTATAELCRRAAREVLDLVSPRKLPFGSHKATPADRDYLLALLESGFEESLEPSRRRVVAALRAAGDRALAGLAEASAVVGGDPLRDLERALADSIRLVEARVFARCQAYLRGYLEGGYVDAFFRRDLPKIDLVEDAVYHALYRDAPNLDEQIAVPLAGAGYQALDAICDRLSRLASMAAVIAQDVELGALRLLDAIDERRKKLAA